MTLPSDPTVPAGNDLRPDVDDLDVDDLGVTTDVAGPGGTAEATRRGGDPDATDVAAAEGGPQ